MKFKPIFKKLFKMALQRCCLDYIHCCYLTFKLAIYVNIIQFLHNRKKDLNWKSNPGIYISDSCCKQQTPQVFYDHGNEIR